MTSVATIIGSLGLILSVVLLAWQTRAVAEQTRISNSIAGATVLSESTNRLRDTYELFVQHPELRAYFYENKPCPQRGSRRERVLSTTEAFADTLESGLFAYEAVPSSAYKENWTNYCQYMLRFSPALRNLVGDNPEWWPALYALMPVSH